MFSWQRRVPHRPRAQVEERFVDFGLSQERASCLAEELDERLERDDLMAIADYVAGLNEVETAREALNALSRIENPTALAAIGPAGLACAFNS